MIKELNLNDSVIVCDGLIDPDDNETHIGGWCGRVIEFIDDDLIKIVWDSITLKSMSFEKILKYEDEGIDWSAMYLEHGDVKKCLCRDTLKDVEIEIDRIERKLRNY